MTKNQDEIYVLEGDEIAPLVADTARELTTPDGLPQDELVWAEYHFTGYCGLSCQFRWKSGRQDAVCFLNQDEQFIEAMQPGTLDRWLESRETLRTKVKGIKEHGTEIGNGCIGDPRHREQAARC